MDVTLLTLAFSVILLLFILGFVTFRWKKDQNDKLKYRRTSSDFLYTNTINQNFESNTMMYQNDMYRMENIENNSNAGSSNNSGSPNDIVNIEDNIPFTKKGDPNNKKKVSNYFSTNPLKSLFSHQSEEADPLDRAIENQNYYPRKNSNSKYASITNFPNPYYSDKGIGIGPNGSVINRNSKDVSHLMTISNKEIVEPNPIHLNQMNPRLTLTYRNNNNRNNEEFEAVRNSIYQNSNNTNSISYRNSKFNISNYNNNNNNNNNENESRNLSEKTSYDNIMVTPPPSEGILLNKNSSHRNNNNNNGTKSRISFVDPNNGNILTSGSINQSSNLYPNNNNNTNNNQQSNNRLSVNNSEELPSFEDFNESVDGNGNNNSLKKMDFVQGVENSAFLDVPNRRMSTSNPILDKDKKEVNEDSKMKSQSLPRKKPKTLSWGPPSVYALNDDYDDSQSDTSSYVADNKPFQPNFSNTNFDDTASFDSTFSATSFDTKCKTQFNTQFNSKYERPDLISTLVKHKQPKVLPVVPRRSSLINKPKNGINTMVSIQSINSMNSMNSVGSVDSMNGMTNEMNNEVITNDLNRSIYNGTPEIPNNNGISSIPTSVYYQNQQNLKENYDKAKIMYQQTVQENQKLINNFINGSSLNNSTHSSNNNTIISNNDNINNNNVEGIFSPPLSNMSLNSSTPDSSFAILANSSTITAESSILSTNKASVISPESFTSPIVQYQSPNISLVENGSGSVQTSPLSMNNKALNFINNNGNIVNRNPLSMEMMINQQNIIKNQGDTASISSQSSIMSNNSLPNSLPGSLPGSLPNSLPGSLPSSLPSSLPGSLPSSLPNSLPGSLPTPLPSNNPSPLIQANPVGLTSPQLQGSPIVIPSNPLVMTSQVNTNVNQSPSISPLNMAINMQSQPQQTYSPKGSPSIHSVNSLTIPVSQMSQVSPLNQSQTNQFINNSEGIIRQPSPLSSPIRTPPIAPSQVSVPVSVPDSVALTQNQPISINNTIPINIEPTVVVNNHQHKLPIPPGTNSNDPSAMATNDTIENINNEPTIGVTGSIPMDDHGTKIENNGKEVPNHIENSKEISEAIEQQKQQMAVVQQQMENIENISSLQMNNNINNNNNNNKIKPTHPFNDNLEKPPRTDPTTLEDTTSSATALMTSNSKSIINTLSNMSEFYNTTLDSIDYDSSYSSTFLDSSLSNDAIPLRGNASYDMNYSSQPQGITSDTFDPRRVSNNPFITEMTSTNHHTNIITSKDQVIDDNNPFNI
ncbi:hypothetical protein U3516DRAFT_588654 [Neocallimastix sp. 'constans']